MGDEAALTTYRQVQVMNNLTNDFWNFPFLQINIASWLLCCVVSMYIIIRMYNSIPFALYVFFILAGADAASLIHMQFKLLSDPCIKSQELLNQLKQLPNGGTTWARAYTKSCSRYQVKIANGRFFDKRTSFVVWQFCVDRLVMCLIM